jgi:hypothetical protein
MEEARSSILLSSTTGTLIAVSRSAGATAHDPVQSTRSEAPSSVSTTSWQSSPPGPSSPISASE